MTNHILKQTENNYFLHKTLLHLQQKVVNLK